MAKDLPYFKFFCSEWNDGAIALEDYEVQGLFINLCSYYWSNECKLTFKKAEKKFKDAPEDLWQTLLKEDIIKEVDEYLVISFLDEQSVERKDKSEKSSMAGKASAEARRLKKLEQESNDNLTPVEIPLNENPTIKKRREEKREEEKRTNIIPPVDTGESENIIPIIQTPLEEPKEEKSSAKKESFDWNKLKYFINKHTGRKFKVINSVVRAKYIARLKEGYTKEDITAAITNAPLTEYHKENNCQYCTPTYFSRADIIDKYSEVTSDSGKIVASSMNKS